MSEIFGQAKQSKLILMWGRFRYLWNSVTFYIQIAQFGSILLLVYNDSLRDWFYNALGINVSFWFFIGVVFAALILGIVFEHKYTIPGSQRYAGEQFIKHSPFADMQNRLDEIEATQKKIAEKLGL